MSEQDIKVPDLGGADDVEVIEVLVSEGDTVAEEDPLLTLESDKASVELPSPYAGKITGLSVKVGDRLSEGDVVGTIDTDADDDGDDDDDDADDREKDEQTPDRDEEGDEKDDSDGESEDEDEPEDDSDQDDGQGGSEDDEDDEEDDRDADDGDDEDEDEVKASEKDEDDEATDKDKETSDKQDRKKSDSAGRRETIKVPSLDGFDKVPVVEVNVSEGDTVSEEDSLVTVESDKAAMDIPSPYAGRIEKVLVKEGDEISEGDDLVEIALDESGDEPGDEAGEEAESDTDESKGDEPDQEKSDKRSGKSRPAKSEKDQESRKAGKEEKAGKARDDAEDRDEGESGEGREGDSTYQVPSPGSKVHAGPAVRKLARELGADLTRVKATGPKDRILKDDVESYIRQNLRKTQEGGSVEGAGIPGIKLPDFTQFGEVEREAMSRMMTATATNMQKSWLNVPHVTQFDEADITEMEAFRKGQKQAGEQKGIKLTPLPFILKACAAALEALPQFNVSLDMKRKEVVRKKYIHIGIAVDTPHGLMVPVIRDVDQKGLWQLAEEATELADKARERKLKPAEMQGACFTITSLGGIGGTAFTPIVNTPEVAILGVSRAATKPVWDGNTFQPRLMLPLSLSYDHRAVNGADAARFTSLLAQLLGDIRQLLL